MTVFLATRPILPVSGADGVLQAMILSIGSLQFGNNHLEMKPGFAQA